MWRHCCRVVAGFIWTCHLALALVQLGAWWFGSGVWSPKETLCWLAYLQSAAVVTIVRRHIYPVAAGAFVHCLCAGLLGADYLWGGSRFYPVYRGVETVACTAVFLLRELCDHKEVVEDDVDMVSPATDEADAELAPELIQMDLHLNLQTGSPLHEPCSICLEVDDAHLVTCKLPCAHRFHEACIRKWFATGVRSCPLCREVPITTTTTTG